MANESKAKKNSLKKRKYIKLGGEEAKKRKIAKTRRK